MFFGTLHEILFASLKLRHTRYGLGIRRFRNGGSTGNGDGGRAATPTAAAAAAAAAAASVANGGGGGKRGGGERDLGAGGSVSQCFEQVPGMFFDKGFTLQVCNVRSPRCVGRRVRNRQEEDGVVVVIFQASRARCLLILFVSHVVSSGSDKTQKIETSYHTTKHARSPVDVVFALPAY